MPIYDLNRKHDPSVHILHIGIRLTEGLRTNNIPKLRSWLSSVGNMGRSRSLPSQGHSLLLLRKKSHLTLTKNYLCEILFEIILSLVWLQSPIQCLAKEWDAGFCQPSLQKCRVSFSKVIFQKKLSSLSKSLNKRCNQDQIMYD